jgi:hypothetical protein
MLSADAQKKAKAKAEAKLEKAKAQKKLEEARAAGLISGMHTYATYADIC